MSESHHRPRDRGRGPDREREVLGDGERAARRQDALDGRVIRQVQEKHDALKGACGLELRHEVRRLAVRDAHRAEHDGELLTADDACLPDDLRGELIGRKTRTREDRQLLSTDERVEPVDGRDACLDEVSRLFTAERVDRRARDVEALLRDDGRAAIDGLAGTVQDTAEQLG